MTFAIRLKELRESKNLSQYDLANELGISQSAIGNWEAGKREPNFTMMQTLANYFGVSVDYLLGRADEKQGVVLDGVYFRIASEAQEVGLPPEDIQKIIDLYKKYKKN